MKNFFIILLAIIAAIVVVGGVGAFTVMNQLSDDGGSDSSIGEIVDKVSSIASSDDAALDNSGDSDADDGSDSDIVSEEVKFNAQNGEGYYREVTYKDGGFRQYDTESDELIGSSYDSDQDKLPSLE